MSELETEIEIDFELVSRSAILRHCHGDQVAFRHDSVFAAVSACRTKNMQSDLARGRRIRLVQDYYGQQYAEVQPRWGFWGKKRVQLDHNEAVALRELIAKIKPERR